MPDRQPPRRSAAPTQGVPRAAARDSRPRRKKPGAPAGPLTGAQILWECLVREGVTDVFGYPGGAILPAYDAMLDYPIRHVLVRHEQGATHMADGYARASGDVGVAIATSGPGATNMVTGIATAMMDSSPIVCITGQVGSKLIGSDAFQETDITGITLPITKHNYLVTRADDVAPAVREAFAVARVRPARARCSSTSPRTRSRRRASSTGTPRRRSLPRLSARRTGRRRPSIAQALELINARRAAGDPRRPRHHAVGRDRAIVRRSPRRAQIPVAMTLLGIGGVPGVAPAQPRHDGHARRGLGQHGDPGSRPADRARHAVRRPRHRQPQDLRAERQEDPRRHRSAPRSTRTSASTSAIVGDLARGRSRDWLPRVAAERPLDVARAHRRAQGRLGRPRHPEPARRRPPLRRARHQRPLARRPTATRSSSPTSASTRCGKRSTTSTTRRARSSPRAASARWASRCRRRSAPRSRGPDAEVWVVVGDGGFQMTMCRAGDDRAGRARRQHRDHQQRLPRHGPAVAGVLLRARATPPRRSLSPDFVKLAEAFGIRGVDRDDARARSSPRSQAARAHAGAVADRLPGRAGRLGVSRWCRPAPTCTR